MAAQLIQIPRHRPMITASLQTGVAHEQSNGLFFSLTSLAVPAGMSHVVRIELSAKRLGIGARSRWTDDFPQISTQPTALTCGLIYTYLKEERHDARNRKVVQRPKGLWIHPAR
jgi:hypothetical protein